MECARLLLAHGARPDLRDDFGATALVLAALEGQPSCVALLLEAGSSRGAVARTPKGSAYQLAREQLTKLGTAAPEEAKQRYLACLQLLVAPAAR